MSSLPDPSTQPEPAEGEPARGRPEAEQGDATGVSAEEPAEGGDDVAPPNEGSPDGAGERAG